MFAAILLAFTASIAVFGQTATPPASTIEIASTVNGDLWKTLNQKEKGILVTGIIDGLVAQGYATVGMFGARQGDKVFGRLAIELTVAQIVRIVDGLYADPDKRKDNLGILILLHVCVGGKEIARDILSIQESDW